MPMLASPTPKVFSSRGATAATLWNWNAMVRRTKKRIARMAHVSGLTSIYQPGVSCGGRTPHQHCFQQPQQPLKCRREEDAESRIASGGESLFFLVPERQKNIINAV